VIAAILLVNVSKKNKNSDQKYSVWYLTLGYYVCRETTHCLRWRL